MTIPRRKPLPRPMKPISRGPAPARRTRVKQRRERPRRREQASPVDVAYQAFVRRLPCILSMTGRCVGAVEAHHAGVKPGKGMKAPADSCIPLCHQHHIGELHGLTGFFKGFDKARLRAWQDVWIDATRAAHARSSAVDDDLPF